MLSFQKCWISSLRSNMQQTTIFITFSMHLACTLICYELSVLLLGKPLQVLLSMSALRFNPFSLAKCGMTFDPSPFTWNLSRQNFRHLQLNNTQRINSLTKILFKLIQVHMDPPLQHILVPQDYYFAKACSPLQHCPSRYFHHILSLITFSNQFIFTCF